MMTKRPSWREFFYFSQKDRVAALVLLAILAFLIFVPYLYPKRGEMDQLAVSFEQLADSTAGREQSVIAQESGSTEEQEAISAPSLFYFDPNTLDAEGWKKLGLSARTIRTLLTYRNKGGQFRKPADLMKIYGLSASEKERLLPWIRLPATAKSDGSRSEDGPDDQGQPRLSNFPSESTANRSGFFSQAPKKIDINRADSADWEQLPAIGPVLASRILRFRDRLGGFHTVEQVREVYGLPDSSYRKFESYLELNSATVSKLNINRAGIADLGKHPYIGYKLARSIVNYREQHGPYLELTDLEKILSITPAGLEKMRPYLSTTD